LESTNDGISWTDINAGLPNDFVNVLVLSGPNVFAGTYADGIWRRKLSELLSSVDESRRALPHSPALVFTVQPNPARDVLHVGATGYGFLMAATGVGSLVAALSIAFGRRNHLAFIGFGAALTGVAELVLAASGSFGLALIAMFATGLGAIGMAATANTTIQLTIPDKLRGRVMSVYTTVFAGSTPIGGLVAGAMASSLGVPEAIAIGAGLSLVVGLVTIAWYRRDAAIRRASVAGMAGGAGPEGARRSSAPG